MWGKPSRDAGRNLVPPISHRRRPTPPDGIAVGYHSAHFTTISRSNVLPPTRSAQIVGSVGPRRVGSIATFPRPAHGIDGSGWSSSAYARWGDTSSYRIHFPNRDRPADSRIQTHKRRRRFSIFSPEKYKHYYLNESRSGTERRSTSAVSGGRTHRVLPIQRRCLRDAGLAAGTRFCSRSVSRDYAESVRPR